MTDSTRTQNHPTASLPLPPSQDAALPPLPPLPVSFSMPETPEPAPAPRPAGMPQSAPVPQSAPIPQAAPESPATPAPQSTQAPHSAPASAPRTPAASPSLPSGAPPSQGRGRGAVRAADPRDRRTPWLPVIAVAAATSLVFGGLGAMLGQMLTGGGAAPAATTAEAVPAADDWTPVANATEKSVVAIKLPTTEDQSGSQGSGVVWDDQGRIVTNHHVIANSADGKVSVLVGTQMYSATVVGSDAATDLALLQLDTPVRELVPIPRADSNAVEVGDEVAAIGNPLGLSGSVTTGIISALDRPISTGGTQQAPVITNAIQTSAALNPGNSGGALVDREGRLIGINSAIATLGGQSGPSGNIGIGFAIPVALAEHIVGQLIEHGTVQHAYLGVVTRDATAELKGSARLGAGVVSIVEDGPAAEAGLREGDLIVAVDGRPVSGSRHLVGTVRGLVVGGTAKITVIRDGAEKTLEVTLGVSPDL